jgi:hypothetical protein
MQGQQPWHQLRPLVRRQTILVKLPKCHMDKPSDGVRLNAFNFDNVLFMFPFMMVSRLKISKGLDSPLEHKRRVLKSCGRGERCYLFWVIPPVNHPTRLRSVKAAMSVKGIIRPSHPPHRPVRCNAGQREQYALPILRRQFDPGNGHQRSGQVKRREEPVVIRLKRRCSPLQSSPARRRLIPSSRIDEIAGT